MKKHKKMECHSSSYLSSHLLEQSAQRNAQLPEPEQSVHSFDCGLQGMLLLHKPDAGDTEQSPHYLEICKKLTVINDVCGDISY